MRRLLVTFVALLALGGATASVAVAQNPHFKGKTGPTARDLGTVLQVTGTLAGLGQAGGTIEVVAEGVAIVTCTNPGGNEPPGQQPLPLTLSSGEIPFTAEQISKSGNFTFNVQTLEPSQEDIEAACKPHFDATLADVQFESFVIIVRQDGEETVLGPFDA